MEDQIKLQEAGTRQATTAAVDTALTPEKFEAFLIVRKILAEKAKPERLEYRDNRSYFAIVLDGNSRRTVCRLYLSQRKFIGTISERKVETKTEIDAVNDIYKFAKVLVKTVTHYDNK